MDRLADDYPVLVAPGQPGLRVNQTPEEALRYSPKKADVINLETGVFETVDMRELLERHGEEFPLVRQMISIADHDHLRRPVGLVDFSEAGLVMTFEGLISDSPFVTRMRTLLQVLREKLKTPVDIEFASDGRHVYLLQCRPQGATEGTAPVPIPRDLPQDRVLFTARRYVSNGQVSDISHVVYVDPEGYARLELDRIREVGRAVGRLNRLLPKRQFILMGPGRWGSRGDIRLGVPVTYADISNAAVLVEVARKKGGYVPDLSFGTHFFQDLVESNIRYLPLYPDDPDVVFNEAFFLRAPNALASLAPEFEGLSDVLRVIDVAQAAEGRVLRILMNGDLDEAVGVLAPPTPRPGRRASSRRPRPGTRPEDHWRWRLRMAQRIAALIDAAPLRREGRLRVRLHEERHGGAGQRHRPAAARRGRRRPPARARALARRLEPVAGRDELPAHRLPDGRAPRRPLRDGRRHRRRRRALRRQDRRRHRRRAAAGPRRRGRRPPANAEPCHSEDSTDGSRGIRSRVRRGELRIPAIA